MEKDDFFSRIKFDQDGLIPAVIQDKETGKILMVGWMNREALQKTLTTRKTHFWSRSRKKLWLKGEKSGHIQEVKEIWLDCDGDTLLIKVKPRGAACHTGHQSCFFLKWEKERWKEKERRVFDPQKVYGKND